MVLSSICFITKEGQYEYSHILRLASMDIFDFVPVMQQSLCPGLDLSKPLN